MDNFFARFSAYLATQTPVLLVYVAGLVLAIVYWSRYPRPCAFTLAAVVLLLATSIGQSLFSTYLLELRHHHRWEMDRFQWLSSVSYWVGSFLRALGSGLLLTAVFVGRYPSEQCATELNADDLV